MPIIHKTPLTVAAHRGDSYNYPENTASAFASAYESGAEMIETDVRLTKDDVLVLMHDATLDRTTNGKGRVKDYTYSELYELNAGTPKFPEKIPRFDDFLKWASTTHMTVNIEIKEYNEEGNKDRCERCIEKVIALVEKYNMSERILINSFDAYVLEYTYKKYGKKYMLHGFYPYSIMDNSNTEINPDEYLYCACIFDIRNKEAYSYLSSRGIETWIGASNTSRMSLETAIDNGAVLVTTNFPEDAIKKVKEIEKNGCK